MKRAMLYMLVLAIIMSASMAGCDSQNTGANNTIQTVTSGSTDNTTVASANNAKKIKLSILSGAWNGDPQPADSPYKKWVDGTFNVDVKFESVKNFPDQVMVRFSSNDMPDIIAYTDKNLIMTLYNQGVLMDDWNQYQDEVPTIFKQMNDAQKKALTVNGKLIAVSAPADPPNWSFKIRKDWLANLGLQMPATPEELLNVARAFTYNDPDKDGKNDTYAFTSAGAKNGVGEIGQLVSMWGPYSLWSNYFYLDNSAKKVSHPIVDGNWKKFLDFMRTVVKEKLIDPDWYTIAWEDRKPKLYNGAYGVCFYPGVLANETYRGVDKSIADSTADWWQTMPMPKGSDQGGLIPAGSLFESIRTITLNAAKDPEKLNRILQLFDRTEYPNDGFYALRRGTCAGRTMQDGGNGTQFIDGGADVPANNTSGGADWGYWIATRADMVYENNGPTLDKGTLAAIQMDRDCVKLPATQQEPGILNFDSTILETLNKMEAEFDYKYIIGQENDYNAFVTNWLQAGGQKLLDDTTKQAEDMKLYK